MQKSLIFPLFLDPDEFIDFPCFFSFAIINEANLHLRAQLKQFKIISMELLWNWFLFRLSPPEMKMERPFHQN